MPGRYVAGIRSGTIPSCATAAPLEQPGFAKAIDVLLGARRDLSPEQKAFAKKATTLEAAAEYSGTIPVVKSTETTVVAAPIELIRGREGKNQPMQLSKEQRDQKMVVAKAMGQATEKAKGAAVFEKNGGKYFGLGSMCPSEYRAKRATGWDPKAEFPLASAVLS